MTILVAPLNWGLGHAGRCVPLVQRFLDEGHEVILGGDGESLTLLRRHFPKLRYVYLAPLQLRYGKGRSQVWAMLKALPKLLRWAVQDHTMLQAVLREEHIDRVISDNRFGLYSRNTECIYITHQLHIRLPEGWRWAEPLAAKIHARIYTRYNKVWVPDYEEQEKSLSGELGHPQKSFVHRTSSLCTLSYIGPLSRFQNNPINQNNLNSPSYSTVAVLSGLEPHRTLLESEITARYYGKEEQVLIVQGLLHRPNTRIKRGNLTIVPSMGDKELASALLGAKHIIVRSGYSTIMDLEALGLLNSQLSTFHTASADRSRPCRDKNSQLEFIPTPGQPEQEYLAFWVQKRTSE